MKSIDKNSVELKGVSVDFSSNEHTFRMKFARNLQMQRIENTCKRIKKTQLKVKWVFLHLFIWTFLSQLHNLFSPDSHLSHHTSFQRNDENLLHYHFLYWITFVHHWSFFSLCNLMKLNCIRVIGIENSHFIELNWISVTRNECCTLHRSKGIHLNPSFIERTSFGEFEMRWILDTF